MQHPARGRNPQRVSCRCNLAGHFATPSSSFAVAPAAVFSQTIGMAGTIAVSRYGGITAFAVASSAASDLDGASEPGSAHGQLRAFGRRLVLDAFERFPPSDVACCLVDD